MHRQLHPIAAIERTGETAIHLIFALEADQPGISDYLAVPFTTDFLRVKKGICITRRLMQNTFWQPGRSSCFGGSSAATSPQNGCAVNLIRDGFSVFCFTKWKFRIRQTQLTCGIQIGENKGSYGKAFPTRLLKAEAFFHVFEQRIYL